MSILEWLQQWYALRCDGEREFQQGIIITSTSNPGWSVEINISDTVLEGQSIRPKLTRKSADDWYGFVLDDDVFVGSGDPSKLEFILTSFRELLEGKELP